MSRVPWLVHNLCDLFRPRSHSPRYRAAIIYPPLFGGVDCHGFLRSFFEFPGNNRIKSTIIVNYNETNYLFQLAVRTKEICSGVSWNLASALKFNISQCYEINLKKIIIIYIMHLSFITYCFVTVFLCIYYYLFSPNCKKIFVSMPVCLNVTKLKRDWKSKLLIYYSTYSI